MNQEFIITLLQDAMKTVLLIAAPGLAAGLIVGVALSLVQAITQINEVTLTFIPKIVSIFVALLMFASKIMGVMIDFTLHIFSSFSNLSQ